MPAMNIEFSKLHISGSSIHLCQSTGDCPLASVKLSIIIVTWAFSDTINDKSWQLLQREVYGYLATGLFEPLPKNAAKKIS